MQRQSVVACVVAAAAIALAGCSSSGTPSGSPSSPTFQTAAADSRCANTGAELVRLPAGNPDEPALALPKPSGWTFSTEHNSSLVRGAVLNPRLQANNFVPNAVATLADVTGDASTPQQALVTEEAGLAQKVSIGSQTPGSLCGYPSNTVTYTIDGRPGTTVIVAAKDGHNRVWVSTVGIQTTEPDNPDFVKAKHVILDGFQFSVPGGAG